MTENNSELDMRTNCPYCKIDINTPEHDTISCLHQSYSVYVEAQARIQTIEDRLQTGGLMETPPPNTRSWWEKIRWGIEDISRIMKNFVIIIALLRFILFGLGV
ncbi:MAG: hypothetical protein V3U54_13120 [Thermodesulfobacteriota bacterium]